MLRSNFVFLLSSYSSFVNKYQDLSLMLFKFYKQLRIKQYDQISDDELPINLEQIDTPNSDTRGVVVRIPQGLFDVACEDPWHLWHRGQTAKA